MSVPRWSVMSRFSGMRFVKSIPGSVGGRGLFSTLQGVGVP